MGYIVVRPRDPERAHGFRGIVFPYPYVDAVIDLYQEMGGSEEAEIVIKRRKDGYEADVQVYEPKAGEGGDQAAP